ncbi:hypothetical protein HOY80DRAFT_950719 [Tuber brumale]|nr:hypothetical protein HOY80DRAFT_950719 [Tuber brumale]
MILAFSVPSFYMFTLLFFFSLPSLFSFLTIPSGSICLSICLSGRLFDFISCLLSFVPCCLVRWF